MSWRPTVWAPLPRRVALALDRGRVQVTANLGRSATVVERVGEVALAWPSNAAAALDASIRLPPDGIAVMLRA